MIKYNHGSFGILDLAELEGNPLILLDGGIERRSGEHYDFYNDRRSGYNGYLFQYTLRGQGIFEKDGITYEITKGMGFLVSFPESSRYYLPEHGDWEFIYLHFDGMGAEPFIRKMNQICGSPFYLAEDSFPSRMTIELQKKLAEGARLKKYEDGEFLYSFLCALLRELEHPSEKGAGSISKRADEIMNSRYGELNGVEEVAERLGISFSHLSRTFKQETGISPVVRLTQIRIQNAMKDLLSTEEKIERIAEKNGFTNGNYFCKVFRKLTGLSPGEYRRRGSR